MEVVPGHVAARASVLFAANFLLVDQHEIQWVVGKLDFFLWHPSVTAMGVCVHAGYDVVDIDLDGHGECFAGVFIQPLTGANDAISGVGVSDLGLAGENEHLLAR